MPILSTLNSMDHYSCFYITSLPPVPDAHCLLAPAMMAEPWRELGVWKSVTSLPSRPGSNFTTTPFKINNNNINNLVCWSLQILAPFLLPPLPCWHYCGRGRIQTWGCLEIFGQRQTLLPDKAILPHTRSSYTNTHNQIHKYRSCPDKHTHTAGHKDWGQTHEWRRPSQALSNTTAYPDLAASLHRNQRMWQPPAGRRLQHWEWHANMGLGLPGLHAQDREISLTALGAASIQGRVG